MNFVNCTPHALTLRDAAGVDTTLDPSGFVPRVSQIPGGLESNAAPCAIYGPDLVGAVEGMPDPAPGVVYVVSGIVGAALRGLRGDVMVPGTGPNDNPVREAGRIVAVTRLKWIC